jgi:hypothetical protein
MLTLLSVQSHAKNLTPTDIENWIACQPNMQAFSKQHESSFDFAKIQGVVSISDAVKQTIATLKQKNLYTQASNIVKPYGFSSIDQWGNITAKIFNAMLATQLESPMYAAAKAQMDALASNPNIPAEKREELLLMLGPMSQMMSSAKSAAKEDIKLVQEYALKLQQAAVGL